MFAARTLLTGTAAALLVNTTPVKAQVLSIAPNATFAYSLRHLGSSYSGLAVKVSRSGDWATEYVGFNGADFDCAAFQSFVSGGGGDDSGFAAWWYDQSGRGINAYQGWWNAPQVLCPMGAGRATLHTGGAAARQNLQTEPNPALDFTGDFSVFFVLQYTASNDGGETGGGRGDALEILSHYNPSGYFPGWAVDVGDTGRAGQTYVFQANSTSDSQFKQTFPPINDGKPHFTGWTYSSAIHTATIYTDGNTAVQHGIVTPAATGLPMYILSSNDGPGIGPDAFFSGQFAEAYGWAYALTPSQIQQIQADVQAYYAY